MRMLVLGGGLQGSACAFDLLQNPAVERVLLADIAFDRMLPFFERVRHDDRLELLPLDATSDEDVLSAMRQVDACMNALPYHFNVEITNNALEAGIHYSDLGGNTDLVFQQIGLDAKAKECGISVIPDCGLAPGMGNILAAAGINELDAADSARILVGGLPQEPEPPLNYQIVYSLEGVLDYYTSQSWVLRDGEPQQEDALSGVETVVFPEPLGELEAFHTAGGLSTMPFMYRGRLNQMEYKTLRYPGHANVMRAIRELGLLDLDPVYAGDQQVAPRDVFIACVEPRLLKTESYDLVALRVEVRGTANNEPRTIIYELLDYHDCETGISAMARATGFSLSITGQMQVTGAISEHGASTPDLCVPADQYIRELDQRGIRISKLVT